MLLLRHALAFAADQNPGHLMGGLTRSGEIAVRSVPARVIGIVPGGASFAGTALSTGCAVQNRFVRARCPVFINIEFGGSGRRSRGPGNQSGVGRDLLQLRSRVAAHGKQGQAINFFNLAHHREDGLHRQRTRLDKVGQHQRKIFAVEGAGRMPVVREAARVISAISRGISLDATEMTPTPPSAITGRVTASSPDSTRKPSGTEFSASAICAMFPLASFTPAILATSLNLARVAGSRLAEVRPGTL